MYKSSPFTFFYKYFLPLFMTFSTVQGIYHTWTEGTPVSQFCAKILFISFIWISIFLVQMFLKLKNVEANESGIYIKELKREIKYNEIEWVEKFDLSCPMFVTIKYVDKESEVDKKIAFMPKQGKQSDEMLQFIKDKIKQDDFRHSAESELSVIPNMMIVFLLGIPVFLLSIYFFNGFGGLI